MKKDSSTLHAYYDREVVHPLGKADLKCTVNEQTKNLMFYIIHPNSETLLGISACHDLGLVYFGRAVHKLCLTEEPTQQLLSQYKDLFDDKLGKLPKT